MMYLKQTKGITLIALVITIIVLLILAGITINLTIGQDGILKRAEGAGKNYINAENYEKEELAGLTNTLNNMIENIGNSEVIICTVTFSGENVTSNGEAQVNTNDRYTATLIPESGYKISKVLVTMGGVTLTQGTEYTYENGNLNITSVTGNIEIVVTTEIIKYTVKFSGENVTSNGEAQVNANSAYTATVIPSSGYQISKTTVTMGGVTLTQGTEYTYENGKLNITRVTGNIEIVATTKVIVYTVTFSGENITINGSAKVNANNTYTATLTLSSGYQISEITVTMGGTTLTQGKNYTYENGNIKITSVTGNIKIVVTTEVIPPTVDAVATHNPVTLTYTWEELGKIAKAISDNDHKITRDTNEVKISMNGKTYTVGVGDTLTVTYSGTTKTVRIMGFNHDTLISESAYGEGEKNIYAGISFEFLDFITSAVMNSGRTAAGGWASSELRSALNSTIINSLSNRGYIKQVNKSYIQTGNDSLSVKISQDKLWLLSCSEIWNNGYTTGAYGFAITKEGEQYKYYKNANESYKASYTKVVKNSKDWWLRSPRYQDNLSFCRVYFNGACNNTVNSNSSLGVAPGFAI